MNEEAKQDSEDLGFGLPDVAYASWLGALADLRAVEKGRQVNERFQFGSGYLQALYDTRAIGPEQYGQLRAQLIDLWTDVVDRVGPDVGEVFPIR